VINEQQLEALIAGRTKLLDCTRKGLLKLPKSALAVWLCHWMHENAADESYLSLKRVMEETDLCRNTVQTARKWLREGGWLVRTGGTVQPRGGSGQFAVYVTTVKDGDKPSPQNLGTRKNGHTNPTAPQNLVTEVSSSVSGYGSHSSSSSPSGYSSIHPPAGASQDEKQESERLGGKPQTSKPKGKTKTAPDGTPYPDGFDSWTNVKRLEWHGQHTPASPGHAVGSGKEEKPKGKPRQTPAQRAAADRLHHEQYMRMFDEDLGNELDGDPEIGRCDNVVTCRNWASRYDPKAGTRLCEDCYEKQLEEA